jgi:Ca-activated chloride channel family protein
MSPRCNDLVFLPAIVLLLQAVISVHTELVVAPAVVIDARGHHVGGLTQESFRIFDNGRLQPISAFHHGESSVTLGLIVDRSQSMRPKTQALLAAVRSILRTSRADDELFAVDFNDDVSFALSDGRAFTNDADELAAALAAVRAEGRTALYDGVAAGLEHLERGRAQRRALVLVSDGGDNGSRRKYAEVLALARRSDAVIYAIGLMGSSVTEEQEDAGLLQRLCKDTGGVAYFPKTDAEIATASATVAADLREQYILGFVPAERTDGRAFRKIEVTASAPGLGRLRVRTRSGYIAAGDSVEKRQP